MVKKSVKNCSYLNFWSAKWHSLDWTVPLPGQVRAVQTIQHKKWYQNKNWVLVEKIGPPPPAIKKNSPCTFDRVFSCLTRCAFGNVQTIKCPFLWCRRIQIQIPKNQICTVLLQSFRSSLSDYGRQCFDPERLLV